MREGIQRRYLIWIGLPREQHNTLDVKAMIFVLFSLSVWLTLTCTHVHFYSSWPDRRLNGIGAVPDDYSFYVRYPVSVRGTASIFMGQIISFSSGYLHFHVQKNSSLTRMLSQYSIPMNRLLWVTKSDVKTFLYTSFPVLEKENLCFGQIV